MKYENVSSGCYPGLVVVVPVLLALICFTASLRFIALGAPVGFIALAFLVTALFGAAAIFYRRRFASDVFIAENAIGVRHMLGRTRWFPKHVVRARLLRGFQLELRTDEPKRTFEFDIRVMSRYPDGGDTTIEVLRQDLGIEFVVEPPNVVF